MKAMAQRPAGDQGEEQVGDVVGGVEGIQLGADPELAADDGIWRSRPRALSRAKKH